MRGYAVSSARKPHRSASINVRPTGWLRAATCSWSPSCRGRARRRWSSSWRPCRPRAGRRAACSGGVKRARTRGVVGCRSPLRCARDVRVLPVLSGRTALPSPHRRQQMTTARPAITGNRLVLAGAVMYLLEWAAIFPAGDSGPSDPGTASNKVLGLYTAHPTAVTFLATWCSVVLLGRVLIILGIRAALRSVIGNDVLAGWGAAAMAISVAMEIVSVSLMGSAEVLAARSADPDLIRAFDVLGGFTWNMVFGPLGVAVAATAWAMLRSRAFPAWICVVGL